MADNDQVIIAGEDESYYGIESLSFHNSLYCLNEYAELYFANLLFKEDINRIVYSDNAYALRKRSQTQPLNNLNMPFMNYKISKIDRDSKRKWFNFRNNIDGIYIPELSRKLRISPINLRYESTIWFHRDDDMQYAYQKLVYDKDVETKVDYYIKVHDQDVKMIGIVNYDLELDPRYSESDWLKTNKLHSIGIDFSIETFYIMDAPVYISDKVVLDFRVVNGINDDISNQDVINLIVDKYEETVTEE